MKIKKVPDPTKQYNALVVPDPTEKRRAFAVPGLTWLSLFIIISGFVCMQSLASSLQQQAEMSWAKREDPTQTKVAIQLWEKALEESPQNPSILVALAKACGREYRHADSKNERQSVSELALRYAKEATEVAPQNADAWTEYGEALAQKADFNKGLGGLKLVKQAVTALEKAVALNPKQSYAHMLLSQIYRQAPGRPLSIGNIDKSLEHGKLAVESGPNYAINHLALAKVYLELKEKEKAREQLELIAKLTPPDDNVPETKSDQETAKELLDKLQIEKTKGKS